MMKPPLLKELLQEADELTRIAAASTKTAARARQSKTDNRKSKIE